MPLGLSFPFALTTGSLGYLEVTNDVVSAISSNARSLLVTNWGERLMHPDMGCNLREFLFEPRTGTLRATVAARVRQQFSRWMPFLTIVGLFIVFPEDDPSVPEPGFKINLQLTYGNVPIDLFLLFPSN